MEKVLTIIKRIPSYAALFIIHFYRVVISPLNPGCCRFEPTCSQYGLTAIRRFGLLRGSLLTVKRLSRCRPGGPYGYDPVPDKWEK